MRNEMVRQPDIFQERCSDTLLCCLNICIRFECGWPSLLPVSVT